MRFLAAAAAAAAALLAGCDQPDSPKLPRLEGAIRAEVDYIGTRPGERSRFTVDGSHADRIVRALSPARVDRKPATWLGYAILNLYHPDGTSKKIEIYHTDDGLGAFKVEGRYWRGGSYPAIRRAVESARAASE